MTTKAISTLTDKVLIHITEALAQRERTTTVEVLRHLAEIDRRRLYAPLGYASLFDFCTRRLRYSESGASRRIRVARCARRFPEIYQMLAARAVNVATVAMVSRFLTPENKDELLQQIAGKSQREVEAIAAIYRGGMPVRDRIRPVAVPVAVGTLSPASVPVAVGTLPSSSSHPAPAAPEAPNENRARFDDEKWPIFYRHSGGGKVTTPAATVTASPTTAASTPPVVPCFKFEFGASEDFMKKFHQAKSLMSSRLPPSATMADMFETLMDAYIERHSPVRRAERREKRARHSGPRPEKARPHAADVEKHLGSEWPQNRARHESPAATRYIPRGTRDAVYRRDHGRCAFVGAGGVRCGSTHHLEIDHRLPRALGGADTDDNLRLLCRTHNQMEAERVLGKSVMRRFRTSGGD